MGLPQMWDNDSLDLESSLPQAALSAEHVDLGTTECTAQHHSPNPQLADSCANLHRHRQIRSEQTPNRQCLALPNTCKDTMLQYAPRRPVILS
jgi:hypothetical protein